MSKSNQLCVTSESDAEAQLKALYGVTPIRAGSNRTHVFWCVKNKRAEMSRATRHKNGEGKPLYIVDVK
ncbi:hypothetical protein [Enterovibrio norvegicus]|uniref:hypothetical protein n=1 Tax=Enterovibrio norvegicus TaxID=188144 RepID=UPI000C81CF64|nr:hypothetical protein [Enterovibrio norvegicus]PMN73175.1 hypothetical protein BCT27_12595 [Enterovibrio norvegicus]